MRRFLLRLMPLRLLFLFVAIGALLLFTVFLLNSDNATDRWILPLAMLFAWCSSLAFVLSGYRLLKVEPVTGKWWQRIKRRMSLLLLWLVELLFVLTSGVLLWLTLRTIGMSV